MTTLLVFAPLTLVLVVLLTRRRANRPRRPSGESNRVGSAIGTSPGRALHLGLARAEYAVHRMIVIVDVESFGDPRRTLPHQIGLRAGLYRMIADAFHAAGVHWDSCYHEDRGDGLLILVPPEYSTASVLETMPGALVRALRIHNHTSAGPQRVRLRVAVHAGGVAFDAYGVTSTALTTAFRLLEAAPLREALAGSSGLAALIVSRWVFEEVVRHSAALDPTTFRPVQVQLKEVEDTAWITLPDRC